MTPLFLVGTLTAHSPIDLSPSEARATFRRELTSPEYVERNLMARLWEWLQRWVDDLFAVAATVPLARWIAAMVIALLLLLLALVVVNRLRGSSRAKDTSAEVRVLETRIGADELRRRALSAREQGDHAGAVVDAYRALAVRQVERRRIFDSPGATAHEVGDQLAEVFGDRAEEIRTAASLFDLALYSDRPVTADDSDLVLTLGAELDTHHRTGVVAR